jgi:hypothetical protein
MSDFDMELKERLRELSSAFKDGIEPPATLHVGIMSRSDGRPIRRRPALVRELSLAVALVVFVALIAFTFSKLHPLTVAPVKPSPHPTASIIPWTSTPMVLPPASAQLATPAEAATWIGQAVMIDPVLLPSSVADDYQAEFLADQKGFAVDYASSSRHATVQLATTQPVMAAPGAHGRRTMRPFRGSIATYQVDGPSPTAPRWLFWTETGTGQPIAYSLVADGLSEPDFWQVANSLQPLTANVGVRACVAADLHAASGHGNGAGGQIFNQILLSNHNGTQCLLEGTPQLFLRTSAGRSISLPQTVMSVPWLPTPPGPALMAPNSPTPQPELGAQAGFGQASITYSMWDCPANPAFTSLMIVLPGQRGTLSIPADGAGYSTGGECDGGAVQRMVVSPFLPTQPTPTYVDTSPLSITVTLPDHVRAGQPMHYQVVLTNASAAPFRFHDCPSYTEDASSSLGKNLANYQLNCLSVGWLAPEQSVTFAMVLDMPANTQPKSVGLRWTLHSAYGTGYGATGLAITK